MPTYENTNEDGGSKKDDEYDIEYYERTGGKQAEIIIQEVHDARREISNVSLKQHYTCKYGMIAFFCNFALIGIILVLLSLMFANAGSIQSDEEKPDSIKPPSTEASEGKCETMRIFAIYCRCGKCCFNLNLSAFSCDRLPRWILFNGIHPLSLLQSVRRTHDMERSRSCKQCLSHPNI